MSGTVVHGAGRPGPAGRGGRRALVVTGGMALALTALLSGCGGAEAGTSPGAPSYTPAPYSPPSYSAPSYSLPSYSAPSYSAPSTPAAPKALGPRPGNGKVIVSPKRSGQGELKIDNGTSEDGYITVASGKQVVVGIYVRAGSNASVSDVPDGTYTIYFLSGSGWNSTLRTFTSGASGQRFEQSFAFETTSRSSTIWSITLQPSIGGNARSEDVDPADVPH